MLTCPACGQANPDGFRFCGACATPLHDPSASDERKIVTVLFADLVGSTRRAESADPEDVRAFMVAFHGRVREVLERFGGTVEKFIGDAAMALFGAPVAHEDDPQRAVRAALALRDAVGGLEADERVELRIGVATGEALVSPAANPAAGEAMAAGDVVNTAARLEAAAPAGGILVDEPTFRAVAGVIECLPAELVHAKGKQHPVPVWEVVRATTPLGAAGRRHDTPLVGRTHELELLRAALDRAIEERIAQLVTLIGVPGIGKTRLVAELAETERPAAATIWLRGRSLPYGAEAAFSALGEVVKMQAGIFESDGSAAREQKLAAAVTAVLADPNEAASLGRHLRPLIGLEAPEAAEGRRREAFAAWREFFEALAEQRPLVLVLEDLHFADDGLLDFVDHLIDWATEVPLLVLATSRPELLARRAGWGGGKAGAVTLTLSPLSDVETAEIVRTRTAGRLEHEAEAALLRRAEGNPLYAEEFARMLLVQGAGINSADVPLPESVGESSPLDSTVYPPSTRRSSRTPRSWGRRSGKARSRRSARAVAAATSTTSSTTSSDVSSCAASGRAQSLRTSSTRFAIA